MATAHLSLGVVVTLEMPWWARPVRPLVWTFKVRRAMDRLNAEHEDVYVHEVAMAPVQQWLQLKIMVRDVDPDGEVQCQLRILGLVRSYMSRVGLGTASFNRL